MGGQAFLPRPAQVCGMEYHLEHPLDFSSLPCGRAVCLQEVPILRTPELSKEVSDFPVCSPLTSQLVGARAKQKDT